MLDTKVLKEAAQETWDAGGKLIIPAFSVGRTQEIVYRLNLLAEKGELPKMKVFVDSPLAVNATDVFRSHVECFDDDMITAILEEEDQDPLMFRDLIYVRRTELSKALNHLNEPAIIISASGMCEGGRILHHLKNNIEKENTTVLFAGYQAPHTLGRLILDQSLDVIKIYGEPYELNCKIAKLEGSSGHADQEELLDWAKQTCDRGNVKKIALVHCELEPAEEFQSKLAKRKIQPTIIPEMGDEMIME